MSRTPRGYVQGYNAQAVCNEHQIVAAAEINTDSTGLRHLEPLVAAAERELAGAGVVEAPAAVVADAGYWHHDQIDAIAGRGIHVLIPPRRRQTQARPTVTGKPLKSSGNHTDDASSSTPRPVTVR
jgi:hypothetical protein